jgi:hypothetical protein
MPANPPPINGPSTGTIAQLQSEVPLPFDLVQSFKMSFANRLADGFNVFPFFAYGVDAETEFVGNSRLTRQPQGISNGLEHCPLMVYPQNATPLQK